MNEVEDTGILKNARSMVNASEPVFLLFGRPMYGLHKAAKEEFGLHANNDITDQMSPRVVTHHDLNNIRTSDKGKLIQIAIPEVSLTLADKSEILSAVENIVGSDVNAILNICIVGSLTHNRFQGPNSYFSRLSNAANEIINQLNGRKNLYLLLTDAENPGVAGILTEKTEAYREELGKIVGLRVTCAYTYKIENDANLDLQNLKGWNGKMALTVENLKTKTPCLTKKLLPGIDSVFNLLILAVLLIPPPPTKYIELNSIPLWNQCKPFENESCPIRQRFIITPWDSESVPSVCSVKRKELTCLRWPFHFMYPAPAKLGKAACKWTQCQAADEESCPFRQSFYILPGDNETSLPEVTEPSSSTTPSQQNNSFYCGQESPLLMNTTRDEPRIGFNQFSVEEYITEISLIVIGLSASLASYIVDPYAFANTFVPVVRYAHPN